MRVLVCGSRRWSDYQAIERRILDLAVDQRGELLIIHGGHTEGADLYAEEACEALGVHSSIVRARWKHYGLRAGPIRNRVMATLEPELVIAYRAAGKSKGTDDMIDVAKKRGIPVEVHA